MVRVKQTEAYEKWFNSLSDGRAKAGIDVRIRRLSLGNPGETRPVGEGVMELKIDYGPGYRVYYLSKGVGQRDSGIVKSYMKNRRT